MNNLDVLKKLVLPVLNLSKKDVKYHSNPRKYETNNGWSKQTIHKNALLCISEIEVKLSGIYSYTYRLSSATPDAIKFIGMWSSTILNFDPHYIVTDLHILTNNDYKENTLDIHVIKDSKLYRCLSIRRHLLNRILYIV